MALRSLSRVLGQEMHPVYLDEAGSIGRVMTKFGPTSNLNQSPNFYELLRLQLRNVQKTVQYLFCCLHWCPSKRLLGTEELLATSVKILPYRSRPPALGRGRGGGGGEESPILFWVTVRQGNRSKFP